MEINYCPEIREDIYLNDLYKKKANNGYYIVGCFAEDTFLLIKQDKIKYYQKFFEKLNGKNSIDDLEKYGFGSKVNISNTIHLLEKRGFIKGILGKKHFSEAELFSVNLKKICISYKSEIIPLICKYLVKCYKYILILSIFILIFLLYISNGISDILKKNFVIEELFSVKGCLYTLLFTPLTFGIHEISHRITGIYFGLKQGEISICMFLGFIPMIYIKQKGIYSLERNSIIKVVCSGIASNLLVAIIFTSLAFFIKNEILLYFAFSNIKLVYMNLFPMSLSDGYFLLCILLKMPNLRMFMYRFIIHPKSICRLRDIEKLIVGIMTLIMFAIIAGEIFVILFFVREEARIVITIIMFIVYYLFLRYIGKNKFM